MKGSKNAMLKTVLDHCKVPEKPRALLLGPRGISAVNLGGNKVAWFKCNI